MRLAPERLKELRGKPAAANGGATPPRAPRPRGRIGYRARTLGVAALLALLALILVLGYVRSYKGSVDASSATGIALVATKDIEPGTPASGLGQAVRPREVVRAPGAVEGLGQLEGLVVAEPIYAGEQVTIRRFKPAGQEGLRGELRGTGRALVVPGDRNQLLAGLLRTGDRVDVLAALERAREGGGEETVTKVVLTDLLVLAAGEDVAEVGGGSGASVVLQVTDRQAQKLFYVLKNGQWSLQLRPFGRAAESPPVADTSQTVLGIKTEPVR